MAHGDEEVGMIPPPVELTLSRSQKVTVRRECGSRRCSHLSDLGSPDIGRGKRKWSQMIGGDPKRKWGSLPLSGSKYKKREFLSKSRGRRTIAILLRAKDKRLRHEGLQNPFKPVLKTEQSLLAREKKKNSPVEPRQKNKISNFGTFFLYTQILFTTLSLYLKKDKSQEKTFIFMDYPTICFWHFEHIYIYNRSKEPTYFHFTMWSMLLFHAFLSASIRLTLSCLERSY